MRYEPPAGVAERKVGDETVLVHLDDEQYFSLNETGTIVWSLVSAGELSSAAADELVKTFGVEPEQASADVAELVAQLVESGLLLPTG